MRQHRKNLINRNQNTDRDQFIVQLIETRAELTYDAIGRMFDIKKSRVCQIYSKYLGKKELENSEPSDD